MKRLILSFGLLFCFSVRLLAGDGETSEPSYRRQKPEIEFEVCDYLYKELERKTPQEPYEQFLMKLTGIKHGFSIENFNRAYLRDPFFTDCQFRFMFGGVDYDGAIYNSITGSRTPYKCHGIPDFYFDGRKLLHYAIQVPDTHLELYPFLGFGCRLLCNKMGSVDRSHGYNRHSRYLYLPAGMTFKYQCKNGLSFDICGEADWMFFGLQSSYLPSPTGPVPVHNIQRNGYGLRLSGKVSKKIKNVEFFVCPFFRYWDIPDSDLVFVIREPKNYTRELGIKFGVSF